MFITDQSLKDSIYVLFREIFIAIIGVAILECVNYYEGLKSLSIDVLAITYAAIFTLCTYAILGIYLAVMA